MITNRKTLKVLAFGCDLMLNRLKSLGRDGLSITGSEKAIEAIEKMNTEPFDIVIVDQLAENVEQVCRNAATLTHVPVAVMMQEKYANWQTLRKLEVDGYLPDDTSGEELMARIRAFSRRHVVNQ